MITSVRRRPFTRRPSTPLDDFSSETSAPLLFEHHVKPSVKGWGWVKICSNGQGLVINIAAMPIYGQNLLLQNQERFETESWHIIRGLEVYQNCSNDDRRLTFDILTARSNLRPYTFIWGKC